MKLRVLAIGQKMPAWVDAGVEDYLRRLPTDWGLHFEALPLGSKTAGKDMKKAQAKEEAALLGRLNPREEVIALDVRGQAWSSETLAQRLASWREQARDLAFLIGGPDGLTPACLERAQVHWSLSPLTLPHPLVRVLLAEQFYRAWTLLSGHPYHR